MKSYQDAFLPEKRFPGPSLLATGYYNAATAAFTVLNNIGGDLSDGHENFRAGLARLELDAPNGKITPDQNRQAIGTNFVTEVVEGSDGNLVNKLVKIILNVNQTLGIDEATFGRSGPRVARFRSARSTCDLSPGGAPRSRGRPQSSVAARRRRPGLSALRGSPRRPAPMAAIDPGMPPSWGAPQWRSSASPTRSW